MKKEMFLLVVLWIVTVCNYYCVFTVILSPPFDLLIKLSSVAIALLWLYYLPDFLKEANGNAMIICSSLVITFAVTMLACRYAAWESYSWWVIGFAIALIFTASSFGTLFCKIRISKKATSTMSVLLAITVFNYFVYGHQPVHTFWYFSSMFFSIVIGVASLYYQPYLLGEFKGDEFLESIVLFMTLFAAVLTCRCIVSIFGRDTSWVWWLPSMIIGFLFAFISYLGYELAACYPDPESED